MIVKQNFKRVLSFLLLIMFGLGIANTVNCMEVTAAYSNSGGPIFGYFGVNAWEDWTGGEATISGHVLYGERDNEQNIVRYSQNKDDFYRDSFEEKVSSAKEVQNVQYEGFSVKVPVSEYGVVKYYFWAYDVMGNKTKLYRTVTIDPRHPSNLTLSIDNLLVNSEDEWVTGDVEILGAINLCGRGDHHAVRYSKNPEDFYKDTWYNISETTQSIGCDYFGYFSINAKAPENKIETQKYYVWGYYFDGTKSDTCEIINVNFNTKSPEITNVSKSPNTDEACSDVNVEGKIDGGYGALEVHSPLL